MDTGPEVIAPSAVAPVDTLDIPDSADGPSAAPAWRPVQIQSKLEGDEEVPSSAAQPQHSKLGTALSPVLITATSGCLVAVLAWG